MSKTGDAVSSVRDVPQAPGAEVFTPEPFYERLLRFEGFGLRDMRKNQNIGAFARAMDIMPVALICPSAFALPGVVRSAIFPQPKV